MTDDQFIMGALALAAVVWSVGEGLMVHARHRQCEEMDRILRETYAPIVQALIRDAKELSTP